MKGHCNCLRRSRGKRNIRSTDHCVRDRRVRRKLIMYKIGKIDAVPTTLAQKRVGIRHGLNAPVEHLHKLVHGLTALARIGTDYRDSRQKILDTMIELRD